MTTGGSASGPVVMDTGPMLTWLVLRYLNQCGAPKSTRDAFMTALELREGPLAETEQDYFLQKVGRHSPVLTTTYSAAEVMKLREHSLLKHEEPFFRFRLDLLSCGTITEYPCTLATLRTAGFWDLVLNHGAADASLAWLASYMRCTLVTDDKRLFELLSTGTAFKLSLLREWIEN
jgi:predicted nucleic acid-binding protein